MPNPLDPKSIDPAQFNQAVVNFARMVGEGATKLLEDMGTFSQGIKALQEQIVLIGPFMQARIGNILLELGWKYIGPTTSKGIADAILNSKEACLWWGDPSGTSSKTYVQAIGEAFKKFYAQKNEPGWLQGLTIDLDMD